MGMENVYKVVQYLTDPRHRDAHFAIRDRYLGDHNPTSTLLFISALAQPEMLVEVELFAAGPQQNCPPRPDTRYHARRVAV